MRDTTKVELEQKLKEAASIYNRIHDERIALLRQAHELDRQENEVYATWWAMREALTHLGHKDVEPQHILRDNELGKLGDNEERACDLARHALLVVRDLVGSSSPMLAGWELRRKRDGMTTRGW